MGLLMLRGWAQVSAIKNIFVPIVSPIFGQLIPLACSPKWIHWINKYEVSQMYDFTFNQHFSRILYSYVDIIFMAM